jgi:hypothetical protein
MAETVPWDPTAPLRLPHRATAPPCRSLSPYPCLPRTARVPPPNLHLRHPRLPLRLLQGRRVHRPPLRHRGLHLNPHPIQVPAPAYRVPYPRLRLRPHLRLHLHPRRPRPRRRILSLHRLLPRRPVPPGIPERLPLRHPRLPLHRDRRLRPDPGPHPDPERAGLPEVPPPGPVRCRPPWVPVCLTGGSGGNETNGNTPWPPGCASR